MHAAHEKINMFTAPEINTPTDFTGGTRGFFTDASNRENDDIFARPEWNYNGISPEPGVPHTQYMTPMVKQLRDSGYYTIHIGKGHWASMGTPGVSPYNMGFIVNVAGNMAGMPRSYYAEDNFGNQPDKWTYSAINDLEEYYGSDINLTQAITDKALKAMDYPIEKGEPFYLYMAHFGVHTPIHPEPQFYQKYLDAGQEEKTAMYSSMVESVDESLGQIMDYLERKGVADNTVIIFYSDNGGHSLNTAKNSVPHTFNAPLREGKGSVYEGGVRVPMMVYWLGKTEAGIRINTPVTPPDFYPSICEMAGVENPETVQKLDGKSFVKLVTDGSRLAKEAVEKGKIRNQKVVFH
jgi:arylsulfatase A-like enzyme